jgi:hypothetical protein
MSSPDDDVLKSGATAACRGLTMPPNKETTGSFLLVHDRVPHKSGPVPCAGDVLLAWLLWLPPEADPGKASLAKLNLCRQRSGTDRSNDGCEISCLRSVARRSAMKPMPPGESFLEGDAVGKIAVRPKAPLQSGIADE